MKLYAMLPRTTFDLILGLSNVFTTMLPAATVKHRLAAAARENNFLAQFRLHISRVRLQSRPRARPSAKSQFHLELFLFPIQLRTGFSRVVDVNSFPIENQMPSAKIILSDVCRNMWT